MINQLIDILNQEASLFETFLDLLDRQKQALVKNDVQALDEVTRRQQEKLIEGQRLSRARERLIDEISAANAIDGDLTVTRLLEFVDAEQASQLKRLREIVLSLNDQIVRTRNTNAMLINQSREFISKTMTMLSRVHHQDHTYDRAGGSDNGGHAVMIDGRI
jgi:flagellar biosynthesis/type III secretory pathway chaperone